VKYYEFGVLSLELESPSELTWSGLTTSTASRTSSASLNRQARTETQMSEPGTRPLRRPYADALREDYHHRRVAAGTRQNGKLVSARELIEYHCAQSAPMIRGENSELSGEEAAHVL
jgi:hypothetical protein